MSATPSLYEKLKAAGVPLDNHESDLYCQATPEATRIVKASGKAWSYFTNQLTGAPWIDVPFFFDPWWEKRATKPPRQGVCRCKHLGGPGPRTQHAARFQDGHGRCMMKRCRCAQFTWVGWAEEAAR